MSSDVPISGSDDRYDPLIGQTIANCRVLARIGQGGMGAVYLAQHTILGRYAAIKVLLPECSNNRELVGRFLNEARATAQLRHAGFVEIFDSGSLRDGSAYLVMEHLRGANLGTAIDWRTAFTVAETLTVLHHVAASVSHAHKHGIVHRDLKPDNIFLAVSGDDASGRDRVTVKVLDFGIAKLTGAAGGARGSESAPSRTRTGSILGTPLYMSPEQCRGAGQVDHRADIYSLGCIAYHALTGQPPFALEGFGEIIAAHLNNPPVPLRARAPSVPGAAEAFVLSLLAKDPGARPQTMDAVTAALVQLRDATPGGDADLLALIPPAALTHGLASLSAATPIGVATQQMPSAGLTATPLPVSAAKSGETRLLPVSARLSARASLSTLGGAASEVKPRRTGRAAGVTIGVLAVALTASLLLTFGRFDRGSSGRVSVDPNRPSSREIPEDETRPFPSGRTPGGAFEGAAPQPQPVPNPPTAQTDRPSSGSTVIVRIASAPPGASVVDTRTGRVTGETPFEAAVPRADGQLGVLLRKRGYRPKRITVDLKGNTDVNVTLDKHPAMEPGGPDDSERRKL